MQTKRLLGSVLLFGSLFLVGCGKTATNETDTEGASPDNQEVTYDENGNVVEDGSENSGGNEEGSTTDEGSSSDANGESSATPEQQAQVNDANDKSQSGKSGVEAVQETDEAIISAQRSATEGL